jgi:hypothetical protein
MIKNLLLATSLLLISTSSFAYTNESNKYCSDRTLDISMESNNEIITKVKLHGCNEEGQLSLSASTKADNRLIENSIYFNFHKDNIISFDIKFENNTEPKIKISTDGFIKYMINRTYTIFESENIKYTIKVEIPIPLKHIPSK